MEPKELRIGNWIYDDLRRFSEVSNLSALSLESKTSNGWTTVFKPSGIPLTEDWLNRFGFEKFDSYDFGREMNLVPRYDLNSVSVQLSENVYWYTRLEYDGGTSEHFEPVIEVHFVHSLQNLYFDLTGTELVLSNKPEEI
jgi:hypothetical protein